MNPIDREAVIQQIAAEISLAKSESRMQKLSRLGVPDCNKNRPLCPHSASTALFGKREKE